jgi:hypothetical protein
MHEHHEEQRHSLLKAFFIALLVMFVLVMGWHFLLFAFGITLAMTAGAWGVLSGVVTVLCVATMLFFVFTGVWVVAVCIAAILFVVGAIFMLPFAFPILIPVLIIMLFIAFVRK